VSEKLAPTRFIHGTYRTAPYMPDADWYVFIHKTERARGNPISMEEAKSYRSTLEELSKWSKKNRDASRRAGNHVDAAKWQKQIWIQQDPHSGHFGGGTIKWKNHGLNSRIPPDSNRGKYHRMAGKTKKDTILHIIHTEGRKLVIKAERKGVPVEEMAERHHKYLRSHEIIKLHERSGFWHGVDWNTASLANVERMNDELTEIQQGFRDKYGDLPKGFCDYLRREESSWLKSIMDRAGCTLAEAIEIDKAGWGCSRKSGKLPFRKFHEKGWRSGFNWVDPAIAKAKADAEENARLERERIEAERIEAENAKAAKVAAEKAAIAAKEAEKAEAERVEMERCAALCRKMPEIKYHNVQAALQWIERNIVTRADPMEVYQLARKLNHVLVNEIGYYGADTPEPVAPPPWPKLQKLTKTVAPEEQKPTRGVRVAFTQAHIDMTDEQMAELSA
jgi:hypothetical protein